MYNLLVTAEIGAWDSGHYLFDKSRFLEYTNAEVASGLKTLSNNTIKHLMSLPCLFAYEGEETSVSVGYLTSVKEQGRSILIEYEFNLNTQDIPFASVKVVSALLDIRQWEMNRTHWAVKDADLFGILKKADLIPPNFSDPFDNERKVDSTLEVENTSQSVTTVRGFINKVFDKTEKLDYEVFYRGHSNKKKYKLEPSLFRKDSNGNFLYQDNEHILYRELIVSNSSDFYSDEYTLDKLVRMQHYSLPTRLLDITSNPLIALYFACKSGYGTKEKKYSDEIAGEVILFFVKREKIKYFDSDTASCIANLAMLPKVEKDSIDFSLKKTKFNQQPSIKRLTHFIKAEKPFFESKIEPDHLRKIIFVKGKKSNDRISSQSGAFLLFGIDAILDEIGSLDIQVTRISVTKKREILKDLDRLNINESTVFPYIESSAKYVAEKYSFKI